MRIKIRKCKRILTFRINTCWADWWRHRVHIQRRIGKSMLRSIFGTRKECKVQVRLRIWCCLWSRNIMTVFRKCNLNMHNLKVIKTSGSWFTLMTPTITQIFKLFKLKTNPKLHKEVFTTMTVSSLNIQTLATLPRENVRLWPKMDKFKTNTEVQKWLKAKQIS
jgi:hypothetical protein